MKTLLKNIRKALSEVVTYTCIISIALSVAVLLAISSILNCICYPFKKLRQGYNWVMDKFYKEVTV